MRYLLIISVFLFVSGCAERIDERTGIQVELVPIAYTFKASVNSENLKQVENKISEYVSIHRDKVLSEQIVFTWSSEFAKNIANKTKNKLLKQGVDPKNIHIYESNGRNSKFDLVIALEQYQVLVPVCEYSKVNRYGFRESDCFVESARWQSIQHPEKMVPNNLSNNETEVEK
jgi:hypothetical protein